MKFGSIEKENSFTFKIVNITVFTALVFSYILYFYIFPNSFIVSFISSIIFLFILPGIFIYLIGQRLNVLNQKPSNFIDIPIISILFWIFVSKIFIFFRINNNSINFLSISIVSNAILFFISVGFFFILIKSKKVIGDKSPYNFWNQFKTRVSFLRKNSGKILNSLLFGVFFILILIFSVIRIDTFPTDDVWYHIKICEDILSYQNNFDYTIYNGKITYHYVICYFSNLSGVSLYNCVKYIGIFQLYLALFAFKSVLNHLKLNQSSQILTQVIFILTSFGTILNNVQAWPTALTIIFNIIIFRNFLSFQIKEVRENYSKKIPKNSRKILYYYLFQFSLLLGSFFLHIVNFIVSIIPIILILLTFTCRNKKRYFKECIFYISNLILFIFLDLSIFYTFFEIIRDFSTISVIISIVFIILMIPLGISIEKFIQNETYPINEIKSKNEKFRPDNSSISIDQKYFWKIILPIIAIVSIPLILFTISRTKTYFSVNKFLLISQFTLEICIIAIIVISVLIHRNFNIFGKIQYIFLIYFLISLIILIFSSNGYSISIRFVNNSFFMLLFNFSLYLNYTKVRKNRKITNRIKIILFFAFIFSSVLYHASYTEFITTQQESFWRSQSNLNSQNLPSSSNLIIGSFHWQYCVNYYYNYSEENNPFDSYFLYNLPLETHNNSQSTENNLYIFKDNHDFKNIYLFFGKYEMNYGMIDQHRNNYGVISEIDYNMYINAHYLDRIAISYSKSNIYLVK